MVLLAIFQQEGRRVSHDIVLMLLKLAART